MTTVQTGCRISSALREYLNAIYELSSSRPSVRITDISNHMGISKPSVNRAVNALKQAGLVSHEPYGSIFLTQKGMDEGDAFVKRSKTVSDFFILTLGLSRDAANSVAAKIAAELNDEMIDKMHSLLKN